MSDRSGLPVVIPPPRAYKGGREKSRNSPIRVFPSCLKVGPNLAIEKGKRKVIAADISAALA